LQAVYGSAACRSKISLLPDVAPALHHALPNLAIVWSEDKTQTLVKQIADARPVRAFKRPGPTRTIVLAWRRGSALAQPLTAVAGVIRKAWRT